MFERRDLPDDVAAVREEHCPDAVVLDADRDFETLPPAQAEEIGLVVDSLAPASYPDSWLPPEAPAVLDRLAGGDLTIGAPGDGSVTWTRQTDPPVVIVKPRIEGSPDDFVAFLVATALVEVGTSAAIGPDETAEPVPEHFLGFFRDSYPDLAAATPLEPAGDYQLAAALYDAWLGLQTRETFADWIEERPRLGEAWQDAGDRLEGRVSGLPRAVARGEEEFPDAAELACSAVKHSLELPAPFAALDSTAYRDRGAEYAVAWAEKTFAALEDDD